MKIVFISQYLWNSIYIFYYLVGAYVAENSLNIKKKTVFLIWQIILVLHTLYYFVTGYGLHFYDIQMIRVLWYDNPLLEIEGICLFVCFYDVKLKSSILRKIVSTIAKMSFDMYLASYMFDIIVNRKLNILYQNQKIGFGIALAVCFAVSFMLSFLAAFIKNMLFSKIQF